MSRGPAILALVPDLMAAARIRGAAGDARTVTSPAALEAAIGPETRLVIVDLQAPDAVGAIRVARAALPEDARVIAYGPHVMTDALAAAEEAGANAVMPRGAFVKGLPELVRGVER